MMAALLFLAASALAAYTDLYSKKNVGYYSPEPPFGMVFTDEYKTEATITCVTNIPSWGPISLAAVESYVGEDSVRLWYWNTDTFPSNADISFKISCVVFEGATQVKEIPEITVYVQPTPGFVFTGKTTTIDDVVHDILQIINVPGGYDTSDSVGLCQTSQGYGFYELVNQGKGKFALDQSAWADDPNYRPLDCAILVNGLQYRDTYLAKTEVINIFTHTNGKDVRMGVNMTHNTYAANQYLHGSPYKYVGTAKIDGIEAKIYPEMKENIDDSWYTNDYKLPMFYFEFGEGVALPDCTTKTCKVEMEILSEKIPVIETASACRVEAVEVMYPPKDYYDDVVLTAKISLPPGALEWNENDSVFAFYDEYGTRSTSTYYFEVSVTGDTATMTIDYYYDTPSAYQLWLVFGENHEFQCSVYQPIASVASISGYKIDLPYNFASSAENIPLATLNLTLTTDSDATLPPSLSHDADKDGLVFEISPGSNVVTTEFTMKTDFNSVLTVTFQNEFDDSTITIEEEIGEDGEFPLNLTFTGTDNVPIPDVDGKISFAGTWSNGTAIDTYSLYMIADNGTPITLSRNSGVYSFNENQLARGMHRYFIYYYYNSGSRVFFDYNYQAKVENQVVVSKVTSKSLEQGKYVDVEIVFNHCTVTYGNLDEETELYYETCEETDWAEGDLLVTVESWGSTGENPVPECTLIGDGNTKTGTCLRIPIVSWYDGKINIKQGASQATLLTVAVPYYEQPSAATEREAGSVLGFETSLTITQPNWGGDCSISYTGVEDQAVIEELITIASIPLSFDGPMATKWDGKLTATCTSKTFTGEIQIHYPYTYVTADKVWKETQNVGKGTLTFTYRGAGTQTVLANTLTYSCYGQNSYYCSTLDVTVEGTDGLTTETFYTGDLSIGNYRITLSAEPRVSFLAPVYTQAVGAVFLSVDYVEGGLTVAVFQLLRAYSTGDNGEVSADVTYTDGVSLVMVSQKTADKGEFPSKGEMDVTYDPVTRTYTATMDNSPKGWEGFFMVKTTDGVVQYNTGILAGGGGGGSLAWWAIMLIIIGALVIVALIGGAIFWFVIKPKMAGKGGSGVAPAALVATV